MQIFYPIEDLIPTLKGYGVHWWMGIANWRSPRAADPRRRRLQRALPANHRSGRLLPNLFRFCSQRELTGQGIEDFRVPERPSVINRHFLEAPLVAVAHQVAIVVIHQ